MTLRALAVVSASLAAMAIASPASADPEDAQATWDHGKARLAHLQSLASATRTMRLTLSLREPYTGRMMDARGAVAVKPEGAGALRMILVGPGGTTAVDLWVAADRFRFEVPAIDLRARGDAHTDRASLHGLPVDFLSWWLLRPAAGRMLHFDREAHADHFVVRDRGALVDLRAFDDGRISARRTERLPVVDDEEPKLHEERIEASAIGCGDVVYTEAASHVEVRVHCEGTDPHAPKDRAFEDPDGEAKR